MGDLFTERRSACVRDSEVKAGCLNTVIVVNIRAPGKFSCNEALMVGPRASALLPALLPEEWGIPTWDSLLCGWGLYGTCHIQRSGVTSYTW